MRILLLSAYHTASHRSWCEGLMNHLGHYDWTLLTLTDRYFRYRIRGNPLSWLQSTELAQSYDLIVATSMVDVATLKGLSPHLASIPCVLYFHENQFAFPQSGGQHQSIDPQMVNLYSALASNQLLFNSTWNRDSFLQGVTTLLKRLPDCVPAGVVDLIKAKSHVLAVPIAEDANPRGDSNGSSMHIVWAARWEYDKGPDRLLMALRELEKRDCDYRVSIIGQQFREWPSAFDTIKDEFSHRIEAFGYQATRQAYLQVLQEADLFISTAIHEFQGLSAMEAVACGCVPVLPDRLSYPELFDQSYCYQSYPDTAMASEAIALVDLLQIKANVLSDEKKELVSMERFKWPVLAAQYQAMFEQLV